MRKSPLTICHPSDDIKMATNIFVYWSDGLGRGGGHFSVIVGTGGGTFANESCPQCRAFDQFFPMPGALPGEEGCSRLELTRTLQSMFF